MSASIISNTAVIWFWEFVLETWIDVMKTFSEDTFARKSKHGIFEKFFFTVITATGFHLRGNVRLFLIFFYTFGLYRQRSPKEQNLNYYGMNKTSPFYSTGNPYFWVFKNYFLLYGDLTFGMNNLIMLNFNRLWNLQEIQGKKSKS